MDAEELKKKIRETKRLQIREMEELLTVDEIVQIFQENNMDEKKIAQRIKLFTSEAIKRELINKCNISISTQIGIYMSFSNAGKKDILTADKCDFSASQIVKLINNLDLFIELYTENKDLFIKNKINVFEITSRLSPKDQITLVKRIEELGLTMDEKRQFFATLSRRGKKTDRHFSITRRV
ncbi:MAG: hypothetical protein IKP28_06695 [Clostridia bacterium]|nr:hypothetical protein [Clostridia bacterium]